VGGFLATALANTQGELVVPLHVTGTTDQPRFAADTQRVAEMKARNLVPSLNDPRGLAGSILGAVRGKPAEGGRGRLGDVSGAITGKPAAEPPPAPGTPQEPAPEAKPEPKQPGSRIEDALRGLLKGRQKQEAPADPPK
jgi:hypothetical protein